MNQEYQKGVANWLLLLILMVVAMILLGGATRLTNSGLSITEWKPITGAIPPLSETDWALEFEKYKKIPEFSAEHSDMDLNGFKFIYLMEWSHRQLGRAIGLVSIIGFLFYQALHRLKSGKKLRFFSILLLIGLQGTIGWWMVYSGFEAERVDVHPLRLAVHLGLAFFILGYLFWLWLDVKQNWPVLRNKTKFGKRSTLLLLLVFLQILAGAIVAGTHSGLSYNTWPLMDGKLIPSGYFFLKPISANFVENIATIQFNHRIIGYLVAIMSLWVWISSLKIHNAMLKTTAMLLFLAVFLQILLGIFTLLLVVPIKLALAHQAGAIIVFMLSVKLVRDVRVSI